MGVPWMYMAEINREFPYKTLGARLKNMREKLRESLAEVAGSVEIELDTLTEIEQGKHRPGEDILLLLISHFAVKEDEATKLWELAGYEKIDDATAMSIDESGDIKNSVVVMPVDARISYTDMAHVVANQHGVVVNFMQTNGPGNQPLVVSRLGMSREHAKSLIELLERTIAGVEQPVQQALPAPEQSKEKKNSKKNNT
jgi:transcriptional regulator with XRE-family HTH domain